MSSSGSSFTSSSLGRPPTYGRTYASPVDSTWTPTSGISTISAPTTEGILFQDTPDERVVYLGPWEVVGSEQRRILWQGSYQNELLEHYLPSDIPSDIHPHTLHSRHRPYYDTADMERYLTFQEPHRIRYTTDEGVCIHDQYIKLRYEFTTVEGSIQFQGDVRRKDFVDFYDVDVVWTNVHGRTDSFGKVKGIGAIQRLKLWRDRYTTFHSISVCANKTDGQYREYEIHNFDGEVRGRDDRAKQLKLMVHGRRRSTTDEQHHHRRFNLAHRMRPRVRTGSSSESGPSQQPLDIRYLAIQFTERQGGVILAINAGSSSVKISVFTAEKDASPRQIADTQISGLTAPPAQLTYARLGETLIKAKEVSDEVKSQDDAFDLLLKTLVDDEGLKEISAKTDIAIACHRIVHGGDYDRSQIITQDTYHHLEELSDLAPLHNGVALSIVDTCIRLLPDAVNVACFDSQFHTTIPPHIYTYPINPTIAKSNRLRKYGFHGISYAFITRSVAEFLEKPADSLNIIGLHLGSGASACAIKDGKSWDTSMGLTPLAGLPGATRSGSVDPSLVFHYASDVGKLSPASTKHLHISVAEEILNKQSGWKAMTGTTNFGTVADSDDPACRLAFDIFVDRVCGFIGSYYVTLGGRVDALVFAGGIGERSAKLRSAVVERIACLGFVIDEDRNSEPVTSTVQDLGAKVSEHSILVCQTDEQFEMARLCAEKEDLWE
ncbi:Acetokinase family-domain-containing protein [Dactylonectria estremocensis]|uniref:Probable acetate kinase n=1 Tax=Dactylonectria estremocensis TaxID=1079267 RepID=A0A9P9JCE2_9HYPO|nr:Acetokinase family-domain-containing protein [Dactylonectria estremocensis]